MKILLGDELLEFSDEELDYMYLDEGQESEVFRYGKDVLKIYKKFCIKDRLSEEDAMRLSQIKTQRILLPKKIIRDPEDGHFMGYSLPFIYKYSRSIIPRLKISEFLDELDIILDDVSVLSDNGVDIEDLHIDNVLYNGKFFIGDPGSFMFKKKSTGGIIYRDNVFILNRFVKDSVFKQVKISGKKRQEFDDMFDDYYYIGSQVREVASENETINQFVKRMTR